MIETIYKVFVPSGLMLMMFGMGLQLSVADWMRVARYPRAVLVGMFGQFIVLPAIALAMAFVLPLPLAISAGIIIVAACPGGIISNSVSFLARADIALSVTLTAISSLLALVTVPIFLAYGLDLLQQGLADVDVVRLPVGSTIKQLLMMVFIPLMTGMAVRHYAPRFALRSDRWVRSGGVLVLVILMGGAIAMEFDFFVGNFMKLWPVVFALNIATLLAGYLIARLAGLDAIRRRTIAIEVGVQNVALGAMLALNILERPEWMVVSSVYSVVMFMTSFALIGLIAYRRRWMARMDSG